MFDQFSRIIKNPFLFRLFLLSKLPAAYFSGVRVKQADPLKCIVTVPYKWFSKNPFRSTYFACLSMAAEMSTGVLAMGHTYKIQPAVSMLVTKIEGSFFKKAINETVFTCVDGDRIASAVKEAVATGNSIEVKADAVGKNLSGETVAEFIITWSFKTKKVQDIVL